jgi:hypothetical protein
MKIVQLVLSREANEPIDLPRGYLVSTYHLVSYVILRDNVFVLLPFLLPDGTPPILHSMNNFGVEQNRFLGSSRLCFSLWAYMTRTILTLSFCRFEHGYIQNCHAVVSLQVGFVVNITSGKLCQ